MKSKPTPEQNTKNVNVVLKNALFCHLGMSINDRPYVVTVNFGYDDEYLYFHSGQKGKKVDIIASNPNVCFELNYGAEVFSNKQACNWGTKFRSVIGDGKAELLTDEAHKKKGLLAIMYKYSGTKDHEFNEHVLAHTNVYRINRKNANAENNHWYWKD